MKASFYRISADRKCLTKMDKVTDEVALSVSFHLKESKSILNPVLILEADKLGNKWATVNYAYIPEFSRYYFIEDIVTLNHNMLELHLSVDVLQTYASSLKATAFEIVRSQSLHSGSFIDPELPILSDKFINTEMLRFGTVPANTGKNYIMTVAGG